MAEGPELYGRPGKLEVGVEGRSGGMRMTSDKRTEDPPVVLRAIPRQSSTGIGSVVGRPIGCENKGETAFTNAEEFSPADWRATYGFTKL